MSACVPPEREVASVQRVANTACRANGSAMLHHERSR
jgi:hypothetical protein